MKDEKLRVAIILGFVGFVTSFGAHIVAVNLPFYAEQVGIGVAVIGVLIAAYDFAEIIAKPIFGAVADRLDPSQTIRVGLLLAAVSITLYPFIEGILLVVVSVLAGLGVGTVWTNTDTVVSQLARAGSLGATMGAAGSFKEFGDMIGPLLIGLLSQALGLGTGFVICGVLGLAALLLISRTQLALRLTSPK